MVAGDEVDEDEDQNQRPAVKQELAAFPSPHMPLTCRADLCLGRVGLAGSLRWSVANLKESMLTFLTEVGIVIEEAYNVVLPAFPVRSVGLISFALRADHRVKYPYLIF